MSLSTVTSGVPLFWKYEGGTNNWKLNPCIVEARGSHLTSLHIYRKDRMYVIHCCNMKNPIHKILVSLLNKYQALAF